MTLQQPSTNVPCCQPLREGTISAEEAEAAAARLKAIADPVRLRLLAYMAQRGCEDVCICDMPAAVGVSQPTVSHHMKKLLEAGLVSREQRGKWAFFSILPDAFQELRGIIDFG